MAKSFTNIKQRSTYRQFKVLDSLGIPYGAALPTTNTETSDGSIFVLTGTDRTLDKIYSYDTVVGQWNPITGTGSGADGKSAYEIAVINGFSGTEVQWLASLKGGDGKSAYQTWLDAGNAGDVNAFLLSLKGANGVGIPSGGALGQVLAKRTVDNFETEWKDVTSGAAETAASIKTKYESNANTNAYTDGEKTKLSGLESSKYKGLYLNKTALDAANVGGEGNYADVDAGTGVDVARWIWDTSDTKWVLQQGTSTAETAASIKTKYESSPDTNAFTDAEKTTVANTSGINTGDQDLSGKVDKVSGKGLSTEDYTTAEKGKLTGISTGAQVNDANTTLQGNTFNGTNQLVKTDGAGKLPAIDGSQLTNLPSSGGGGSYYGIASGTNTYAATITGIAAYTSGLTIEMLFTNANTGASTANINGLGALTLVKNGSAATVAGDIPAGAVLTLAYDGTNLQIVGSINALPVVTTGEKAVTVKSDGAHADYDVIDSASASATTGATLAAQDWSTGAVSYTGVAGEVRFYGNYKYECSGTGVWWRTPYNLIVNDFIIGPVSDSGGVKTSTQMAILYPAAVAPQIATGMAGIYMYIGLAGWFYFQNKITP